MAPRTWNPLRLDVMTLAREGESLSGHWPAAELPRFCSGGALESVASAWPDVRWQMHGEMRGRPGALAEAWLRLRVDAQAVQTCQRCLQPVAIPLQIDRAFHFVRDEATAAELDADSEDDVLVASKAFDAREWVEDELLLALPIVPLHEVCPKPLLAAAESSMHEATVTPQAHPFAALAVLRDKSGTGKP